MYSNIQSILANHLLAIRVLSEKSGEKQNSGGLWVNLVLYILGDQFARLKKGDRGVVNLNILLYKP